MSNPTVTAHIYDALNKAGYPQHAQSRQRVAETAAKAIDSFDVWPIGHYDEEDVERLINPKAYDAAAAVCHRFKQFEDARGPVEQADALVKLVDEIGALTTWLLPEDRELLDYGGEDHKDRAREIANRARARATQTAV